MLMTPDSLVAKRAFFASKQLFVTPYQDGQLYPSGDHVVQSEECLGLKQWVAEVSRVQRAGVQIRERRTRQRPLHYAWSKPQHGLG